ncbi:cytochrome P450 [Falsiroseomonas sp.]|uniref:cytochrome P450 n=1 Tax=Falsiroseomonas sp. TaxID=2870721 RepID=UPI003F6FDFAD
MPPIPTSPKTAAQYETELAALPVEALDVAQPGLFELGLAPRYLERLRREAPVHRCAQGLYGTYWSITRARDIEAVELDHETFSSEHAHGGITILSHPEDPQFLPSFLAMDPPRHTAQRQAVAPAFTPDRLAAMAPRLQAWAAEILDGLPIGETFDWVDRVSVELTARALALLLGFPEARCRELIRWSQAIVALPGSPGFPTLAEKMRVLQDCLDSFDAIWEQRLRAPEGEDLLSLLARCPRTRAMPRAEVQGNILLLIVAGNDTTRHSLSASVLAFDRFPGEWAKLRRQPALLTGLAPEILRWQTPVAHMRRTAMRDVTLGGQRIPKGGKVILWYLSANRDAALFAQADDFILDRANARRHFAFGAGIHRCLGARLADLQIRTLWQAVLDRFPRIEVVHPPVRTASTFMHGFAELRVRIAARHAA